MKKSVYTLLLALLGLGGFTSCEDMLTPEMDRYATEFSGKDSVNFYLGIMSNLQDVVEQNVLLGELRGDLVTPTEYATDSINNIINFRNLEDGESQLLNRAAYYKVINQCNFYLDKVDSMAMKNNTYYMRREMAQVQLVRAWTYMQLVQNYGKVPFIVKPVDQSNTGWDINPEDWATPDNLLDLLEAKGGLKQAYQYAQVYGYPNYGNFNTGAQDFGHRMMHFNANVVYGDLHLLRGANKGDYEAAATYYHKYLSEDNTTAIEGNASVNKTVVSGVDTYSGDAYNWITRFTNNSFTRPEQVVQAIPSSANSFFGKMLTRVPQVYGFDATSRYSTTTTTTTDNKENTTSSGRIGVEANFRNRQVEPSKAIDRLSAAQTFVLNQIEGGQVAEVKYIPLGDQRIFDSAPLVSTEQGNLRFIRKFVNTNFNVTNGARSTTSFNFRYGITLNRQRQIYLRYAEALNRAGYPRYAFAILRDGLSPLTLPEIGTQTLADTIYADDAKTDILRVIQVRRPSHMLKLHGANYVGYSSLARAEGIPFLDFTKFTSTYGIHEAGSHAAIAVGSLPNLHPGFGDLDTLYTYSTVVAQRMVDEANRKGQTLILDTVINQLANGELLLQANTHDEVTKAKTANGDEYELVNRTLVIDPQEPSLEEVNAVETLIADEMAMELAFEGFRYYDLMRMARHRNTATGDGTNWMAWLISRRDLDLAPYQEPQRTGSLFPFLNNMDNWYLPAPKQ